MERSTNPTSINPNAKYLPDSISNVLNTIQKFDQCMLAWPTGPRNKHVRTKKHYRIPLAGRASSVISNSTSSKLNCCQRVDMKNTFYQILHASQDQSSLEKSVRRKMVGNSMYDIVRMYLQINRHHQPEVNPDQRTHSPSVDPPVKEIYGVRPINWHYQPEVNPDQRTDSPSVDPPIKEIYRVRPRVAETKTQQKYSKDEKWNSKFAETKLPIVELYKFPRRKSNYQRANAKDLHKSVSKSKGQKSGVHSKDRRWNSIFAETKLPIVELNIPRRKSNDQRANAKDLHKSVSKSEGQKSGVRKRREHLIKEIRKAQKIYSKDNAKDSPVTVPNPRKSVNKSQKRIAETRMQKGYGKEGVKLQQNVPSRLRKVAKEFPERIPYYSKKSSRFQYESPKVPNTQNRSRRIAKLQGKSPANKDKSKDRSTFQHERLKVENLQDNPRQTIPDNSNILKDDSNELLKNGSNCHVNFNEKSRIKRISATEKHSARMANKHHKTIYITVPKPNKFKNILFESEIESKYNNKRNGKIKESNIEREKSILEGKLNNTGKNEVKESIIKDPKSNIEGSKIQESRISNKRERKEESIIKDPKSNIEGKKIQESAKSNKRKRKVESIVKDPKSNIEGRRIQESPISNKKERKEESIIEDPKGNIEGSKIQESSKRNKKERREESIIEDPKSDIQGSKIQESSKRNKKERREESIIEDPKSDIQGSKIQESPRSNKKGNPEPSKIQESITDTQKSISEGILSNTNKSKNQKTIIKQNIANKSNNVSDTKYNESRRKRQHSKKKFAIYPRERYGNRNPVNDKIRSKSRREAIRKASVANSISMFKSEIGNKKGIFTRERESQIQGNIKGNKNSIIKGITSSSQDSFIQPSTSEIRESNIERDKSILEGKLNNTGKSEAKESIIKDPKSNIEGSKIQENPKSNKKGKPEQSKIHDSITDTRKSISEGIPSNTNKSKNQKSIIKRKPIEATKLIREKKTRRESIRKIPPITTYDKFRKLKDYLSARSVENFDGDTDFVDIEGVPESELLLYPYDDIYERIRPTKIKNTKIVKKRYRTKPKEMEKKCEKPLKKRSACCMCQSIWRHEKDAPFLVNMRKEQKRQELMAYRAQMAMSRKPSHMWNRVRQLAICDLDMKLYSLEDKEIIFTHPKRSNSSIGPSSSKTKTFLKRSHSFTFL